MKTIMWDKSYSVGIPELDELHKLLLFQFNRFVQNADKSIHSESFSTFLGDITEFSRDHFKKEEMILKKYGFQMPDIEKQKMVHLKFVEEITEIMMRVLSNDVTAREDLIELFHDWFENHIKSDHIAYMNMT